MGDALHSGALAEGAGYKGLSRERAISLKLSVLVRQLHRRFDQRVASVGITRSQWTMIAVIARRPGATQREVSEILEMSEAAAGRLIERLCSDGLLERRPKEDDRRAYCIHMTPAADGIIQTITAVASEHERQIFAGFTDDDLAGFEDALDRISANSAASERGAAAK